VEESSDGIELVEFLSTQYGTRNNAADRVYSGYGREGFVIVDAIFLSVAFDDQSRFPNSICLRLEYPLAANNPIPRGNLISWNLLLCAMLEKRRVFFLDRGLSFQLIGSRHGFVEGQGINIFCGGCIQCPCRIHLA
jgi:hypothetical protein